MKHPRSIGFAFLLVFSASLLFAQSSGGEYENARALAKANGFQFRWFPIQKMVILSKGTDILRMSLGTRDAVLNNQAVQLSAPAVLKEGEVLVPSRNVISLLKGKPKPVASPQVPPPPRVLSPEEQEELDANTPAEEPDSGTPIPPSSVQTPPPAIQPAPPVRAPGEDLALLTAVRSSIREDHTRIVLEFSDNVTHRPEKSGKNKFKVRFDGCRNVFPTKRPTANGRDLTGMSFNSGPNRQGLVISFDLPEGAPEPLIETVGNPYRMVISFKSPPGKIASATPVIPPPASAPIVVPPPPVLASSTPIGKPPASTPSPIVRVPASAAAPLNAVATSATKPPSGTTTPATFPEARIPDTHPKIPEPLPEVNIVVPLANLSRSVFQGRTIIIDPGHGGKDPGIEVPGLPTEKEITLNIALKLRDSLKEAGFQTFLIRNGDTEVPAADRISMANRSGGDLLVSLHAGNSRDDTQQGPGSIYFAPAGISFDTEVGLKLSPQLVFKEWTSSYRFDLAKYLAGKVQKRLVQHLAGGDRGVQGLPLLPLRFLLVPSVAVEVGMLSNPEESKKLAGPGYQQAVARALANGIIDFFNALKVE